MMMNGASNSISPDPHDFDDMPTGVGIRVLAKMVVTQQLQLNAVQGSLDMLNTRISTTLSIAKLLAASVPLLISGAVWLAHHLVTK